MAKLSRPRRGSLQYWPRKRARKILPSVNWEGIIKKNKKTGLLGFIGYKVGMTSAFVRDNTSDSMTKNKKIIIPVTIIECPQLKIFSVRFYKNNSLATEILSNKLDKELKRKLKLPKNYSKKIEDVLDFDDVRAIVYSDVKTSKIKKKPDIAEIAIGGSINEKISFIKEYIGKTIKAENIFNPMQVVDIRAITKGKGNQGPVKRFGIGLKQHKSEKGRRKPGSLGPWHPARVTFRTPMAGQTGFFTRVIYNNKIINLGNIFDKNINKKGGFNKYGDIKTDYIILYGSVQGPAKRPLIITYPLRVSKKQSKKNYEFIELR